MVRKRSFDEQNRNFICSFLFFEGFATPVQTVTAISPSKKQLSPDHPNPALPITEVANKFDSLFQEVPFQDVG